MNDVKVEPTESIGEQVDKTKKLPLKDHTKREPTNLERAGIAGDAMAAARKLQVF